MSAMLLVGPSDSPARTLCRRWAEADPVRSVTQVTDLTAVMDHLATRSPAVVLIDGSFEPEHTEAALLGIGPEHPAVVRLLLARDATQLESIRGAHQVLPSGGDPQRLGPALDSALRVAQRLAGNPRLAAVMSTLEKVPSPPSLYFDLRAAVDEDAGNKRRIAEIAAQDPALVAEVLRVANSGFYALPRTVSDLAEAVALLGTDMLVAAVLAAHVFSGLPPPGIRLEILWQHSAEVASLARQIAAAEGGNRDEQSACGTAGILHDLGLLVLLEKDPSTYLPMWRENAGNEQRLAALERDAYGMTHGELGALVLDLWSLPEEVVSAVAQTHSWTEGSDLASRSVMAAEWLLDLGGHRRFDKDSEEDPPPFLAEAPADRVETWTALRDRVLDEVA